MRRRHESRAHLLRRRGRHREQWLELLRTAFGEPARTQIHTRTHTRGARAASANVELTDIYGRDSTFGGAPPKGFAKEERGWRDKNMPAASDSPGKKPFANLV